MCFLYLLLGHLMGDFIFQTNRIAENKVRDRRWNLLHVILVTICMLLFSIPFGLTIMALVIAGGFFHYIVDYYKPRIAERYPLPGLVYFLADQAVHVFCIFIISSFSTRNTGQFPLDHQWVMLLLVVVFISSVSAILNQLILSTGFPQVDKRFFEKNEKMTGNAARFFITFGFYFSYRISPLYLFFIAGALMLLVMQFKNSWKIWMSKKYFFAKLTMDIAMSLAGFAVLLFYKI